MSASRTQPRVRKGALGQSPRPRLRAIKVLAGISVALLAGWTAWSIASKQPAAPGAADFRPAATSVPIPLAAQADQGTGAQAVRPAEVGQAAPDFSIETIAGGRFSLAVRRGKLVGVLFFASWCPSCIAETQAWGRLQREYGDRGLEVLMVSADPGDTPEDVERFRQIARTGPDRHWAIDRDSSLVKLYQVRSLDTTLMFDRQGRLAYRDPIPTLYERLKPELEKIL